jgi:hypothetical protein
MDEVLNNFLWLIEFNYISSEGLQKMRYNVYKTMKRAETTMDTDVGVEIDNINDGHLFSETSEVYAFHIGEICIILDFV